VKEYGKALERPQCSFGSALYKSYQHGRISRDFLNETITDSRTVHLTAMENILTSTQKSASCLKELTLGNLHSVYRKEEELP